MVTFGFSFIGPLVLCWFQCEGSEKSKSRRGDSGNSASWGSTFPAKEDIYYRTRAFCIAVHPISEGDAVGQTNLGFSFLEEGAVELGQHSPLASQARGCTAGRVRLRSCWQIAGYVQRCSRHVQWCWL